MNSPNDPAVGGDPDGKSASSESLANEQSRQASLEVPPVVGETQPPTQAGRTWQRGLSPVRTFVDVAIVCVVVVLGDFLVYQHGAAYTAIAVCVGCLALMLSVVKRRKMLLVPAAWIGCLLAIALGRLVWSGSPLAVFVTIGLLGCWAMVTSRSVPWLPETLLIYPCAIIGAVERFARFRVSGSAFGNGAKAVGEQAGGFAAIFVPVAVLLIFSSLFLLANPDLIKSATRVVEWAGELVGSYIQNVDVAQVFFWGGMGWLTLGLLYPHRIKLLKSKSIQLQPSANCPMFAAYRNTLISVTILFGAYLAFEFKTLWFRSFPDDFYYAGYAHQGAFWLTVALALSTATLSTIFNRQMLVDPRASSLKRLSLGWSVLNFLLSAAVVNRLSIYVGYNGLTRMRIIGYLGIVAVVVGFALVVYKVNRNKSFVWLLHRQLWCPAAAIMCYAVLPVDWIVNRYNVSQVNIGNDRPVIQLVAHEFSVEGALPVFELLKHDNSVVREGGLALIAECKVRQSRGDLPQADYEPWRSSLQHASPWLENPSRPYITRSREKTATGGKKTQAGAGMMPWLHYQGSAASFQSQTQRFSYLVDEYVDAPEKRYQAIDQLYQYAYQWY